MKILDSYWFTEMGGTKPIGIVAVRTDHDGLKYYIGTGYGFDRELDEQRIAKKGARFHPKYIAEVLCALEDKDLGPV